MGQGDEDEPQIAAVASGDISRHGGSVQGGDNARIVLLGVAQQRQ